MGKGGRFGLRLAVAVLCGVLLLPAVPASAAVNRSARYRITARTAGRTYTYLLVRPDGDWTSKVVTGMRFSSLTRHQNWSLWSDRRWYAPIGRDGRITVDFYRGVPVIGAGRDDDLFYDTALFDTILYRGGVKKGVLSTASAATLSGLRTGMKKMVIRTTVITWKYRYYADGVYQGESWPHVSELVTSIVTS